MQESTPPPTGIINFPTRSGMSVGVVMPQLLDVSRMGHPGAVASVNGADAVMSLARLGRKVNSGSMTEKPSTPWYRRFAKR